MTTTSILEEEVKRLAGEVVRLNHIIAVMKTHINMAHHAVANIESNTRIREGRLEVWCLGDWVDVEEENSRAALEDDDD